MDKTIAIIEKDLIKKRIEKLSKLPRSIYRQLDRIEKKAFEVWKLDSVFTGLIMWDSFNACANSKLTLDQLEEILKYQSDDFKTFDKLLKKAVRSANRKRGNNKSLIKILIAKTTRNTDTV